MVFFEGLRGGGGAVAQSVERATSGQLCVRSLLLRTLPTGYVSISIMSPAETEVMVFPLCLGVAAC